MDISKVIIPAAGLGTRFLPYTKAVPKEMLPLLNKPAIQYIAQEALASDIQQFLMVTSKGKNAIADYFDADPALELFLKERNKTALLNELDKIARTAHFSYIRQPEPLGLGHAICMARHAIASKEYFGVMLPDDIIVGATPALLQLIRIARQERASVIAVQEVPEEYISMYGVVSIKKQFTPNLFQVANLVEKPNKKDAPSNLAIIGRYVLSQKLFKALDEVGYNQDHGEIQLTDGITQMSKDGEKVLAYKVQGNRFDVGTPIGWIKALISLASQDPYYAPHIREFLMDFNTTTSFVYNSTKNLTPTL
ncbi:UTP--glucose-1-phosphate uridylyltransferase [Candidatus Dependentiae bacterium]|nr:UTP--glucose-1-phosphate uridylyltransferase [Candidatus Dependentiae bacterium]